MKVLVACEFSGVVRRAFAAQGHDAWSCDILPSLDHSPYHMIRDVSEVINDRWDLMIAHPPCTRLCNSGVWVLHRRESAWDEMRDGAGLFNMLWRSDIPRICIENPVPHKYARALIGDYTQTIQPYQFGHPESKRTCLWLKNLPKLSATNILPIPQSGHWENQTPTGQNRLGPSESRAMLRSLTYSGIASAMATQWGHLDE